MTYWNIYVEQKLDEMKNISWITKIFPLTAYFQLGNGLFGAVSLMKNPRDND